MKAQVPGMLGVDELRALVRQGEIDTVLAVFPDLYGRLVGKRITGRFFCEEVLEHGMHACDYLLACDMEMDPVPGYRFASWEKGYGDIRCVPDLSTLRRAAWLERTALVLCDVHDERTGDLVAVAPRTILRRQVERARAAGYVAMGGSELEFFLLRETYESAREKGFDNLEPFGWYVEDYHILQGTKAEPLVGAIRRHMESSGVPVEFSKGEWGPGQHEINLRYTEFLEMADRHVVYKHAAKEIAARQGLAVTFMAKFDDRLAGNSMHLHASLWSAADLRPLFASDGSGSGPTDTFRWWLGGLLRHARAATLLFAPYVNSYKRFRAGSFAPTKIAWAHDNRTVGFRVVGRGASRRIECRIPGADANPYLAYAATLAAGLDGIARKIEPPPAFRGDAYRAEDLPSVPTSLPEAIAEFEGFRALPRGVRAGGGRAPRAFRADRAEKIRGKRDLLGATALSRTRLGVGSTHVVSGGMRELLKPTPRERWRRSPWMRWPTLPMQPRGSTSKWRSSPGLRRS
ncbi:MAG: glutamine synthetase [Candidatus Binatia bacterium]|nr:MAG: glutamine synthetase [Candidatus Binatia bacterium]